MGRNGNFVAAIVSAETGADEKDVQHIACAAGNIEKPDGLIVGGPVDPRIWIYPALAPGPAKQLTHFTTGQVWTFAWSPDGKQLAFGYGNNSSDVVIFSQPK
jgi:hypothetical protein